jgi:hypothetical protein
MNETQNTTVTIWSAVLFDSTANHGLTIRNNATTAMPPRTAAMFRLLVIVLPFLPMASGRNVQPTLVGVNGMQPPGGGHRCGAVWRRAGPSGGAAGRPRGIERPRI